MINRKAIGYITANYSSTYGSVLLKDRPIASVPFLGRYRLIDFPLSNMMNAGIKTVGVVMPGMYRSLIDDVGAGMDWGLDRKKGGLFMVRHHLQQDAVPALGQALCCDDGHQHHL